MRTAESRLFGLKLTNFFPEYYFFYKNKEIKINAENEIMRITTA